MRALWIICLFLWSFTIKLSAQPMGGFTTYSISKRISDECVSNVSMVLFDQSQKQDKLNELIIHGLIGNFYFGPNKHLISLNNFYKDREFGKDTSLDFVLNASLAYNDDSLLSFIVCPDFACNHFPTSTYETQFLTIDAKTKEKLTIIDFIDVSKWDSLANLMYKVATMYRLRSLPTCYITSVNPTRIASSNATVTTTDTVTYIKEISPKFYIADGKLHLYNRVAHRDYDYKDVEVAFPFYTIRYFLRPEMAKRLKVAK